MAVQGVNLAIVVGRLGNDPERKEGRNNSSIAKFSIATSERWEDKNTKEKKERTEWHNCVAYGKLADIVLQYATKGRMVYCEGKMRTSTWDDKESGAKRSRTDIEVNEFQLLDSKNQAGDNDQPQNASSNNRNASQGNRSGGNYQRNNGGGGGNSGGNRQNSGYQNNRGSQQGPPDQDSDIPF